MEQQTIKTAAIDFLNKIRPGFQLWIKYTDQGKTSVTAWVAV